MLADMTAVKSGAISRDMILGFFTLFSLPGRSVPTHTFKTAWAAEGLPATLIPDGQRPVHVFQRACDSVRSDRGVPSDNRVTETAADMVVNDSGRCTYQITRKIRDKVNAVIEHERAMTVSFDKLKVDGDPDQITVLYYDQEAAAALVDVVDRIRAFYDANLDKVTDGKVRAAVRAALKSARAIPVRKSGGCYFVPISGEQVCESVTRVLDHVYGGDAAFDMLPQLNDEAVRGMVARYHTANVREETEELMARLAERLKGDGPKPRTDMVTNVLNQRREIGKSLREYKDLLGDNVAAASEALDLLDDQIEHLLAAAA